MTPLTITIPDTCVPKFRDAWSQAMELMLSTHSPSHMAVGRSFFHCLTNLINLASNTDGHVYICSDFEPLSFGFSAGSLSGGLIYHGPENPSSLSIQLTPTHGWQLHT